MSQLFFRSPSCVLKSQVEIYVQVFCYCLYPGTTLPAGAVLSHRDRPGGTFLQLKTEPNQDWIYLSHDKYKDFTFAIMCFSPEQDIFVQYPLLHCEFRGIRLANSTVSCSPLLKYRESASQPLFGPCLTLASGIQSLYLRFQTWHFITFTAKWLKGQIWYPYWCMDLLWLQRSESDGIGLGRIDNDMTWGPHSSCLGLSAVGKSGLLLLYQSHPFVCVCVCVRVGGSVCLVIKVPPPHHHHH